MKKKCIHCSLREAIGRIREDEPRKHNPEIHDSCEHKWSYNHDSTYKFCENCWFEIPTKR